MAALIPIGLSLAGAIPSFISGILGAVNEGRKLSGGQLMMLSRLSRHPRHGGRVRTIMRKYHRMHMHRAHGGKVRMYHKRRRLRRRHGRGVVSDVLGGIPVLGSFLGPIARAFGAGRRRKAHHRRRRHRRGVGLSPMCYKRPYTGMGLRRHHMRRHYRRRGKGLSPMYYARPYTGAGMLMPLGGKPAKSAQIVRFPMNLHGLAGVPNAVTSFPYGKSLYDAYVHGTGLYPIRRGRGLLAPAGGASYRKGHLRKIHGRGKKVRVRPTIAHHGGYKPYTFRARSSPMRMY